MAVVDVFNRLGEKVSEIDLPDEIFTIPIKKNILHDVVRMQLASRRKGSAVTKTRAEVSGSTRKLYRQKGTGNSRAGSIKSPIRRGGGVIFGPSQRLYGYKITKKVKSLALKMALSSKLASKRVFVINDFNLDQIKTKEFVSIKESLCIKNVLIVVEKNDKNLFLSSRNVPKVKVIKTIGLNVYDILKYDNLLLKESSVAGIKRRFEK